jgi:hypothetical protein
MSSTLRGAARNESDFYPTPEAAFKPLLPFIWDVRADVWEPAQGDGRLVRWMNEFRIAADGSDINAKINPTNFLKDDTYRECIVNNPPFSLAFEFAQHAVAHANHVFLLLRLGFLASQKRAEWFRKCPLDALFVLSKRPSFTPDGKTDSADYAWFYWGDAHKGIIHL